MKISIELTEGELRSLVLAELKDRLGEIPLKAEDVKIEVRSKQNYKSEWEEAAFRARVEKTT